MIFVPILFALFLWFGGYLMTAHFKTMTGIGEESEKIIAPPKWLYYICGSPVSKYYLKGQMRVVAFRTQMGGIFLGIYLIWYVITRPPTSINVIGLGICMFASYFVTVYVSKHFAVKKRDGIRKGKSSLQ